MPADLQEQAVQYVAETVGKLFDEQKQQNLKRIYVISTYVIGKERLLVAVHKKTGCKIGVTQQKMDTLKCLELPGKSLQLVCSSGDDYTANFSAKCQNVTAQAALPTSSATSNATVNATLAALLTRCTQYFWST